MKRRNYFFLFAAILMAANTLFAQSEELQIVLLKSGRSITGYVSCSDDGIVSITTQSGEEFFYIKEEVHEIKNHSSYHKKSSDKAPSSKLEVTHIVTMRDGRLLSGRLVKNGDDYLFESEDGNVEFLSASQVVTIRDLEEERRLAEEKKRLEEERRLAEEKKKEQLLKMIRNAAGQFSPSQYNYQQNHNQHRSYRHPNQNNPGIKAWNQHNGF